MQNKENQFKEDFYEKVQFWKSLIKCMGGVCKFIALSSILLVMCCFTACSNSSGSGSGEDDANIASKWSMAEEFSVFKMNETITFYKDNTGTAYCSATTYGDTATTTAKFTYTGEVSKDGDTAIITVTDVKNTGEWDKTWNDGSLRLNIPPFSTVGATVTYLIVNGDLYEKENYETAAFPIRLKRVK